MFLPENQKKLTNVSIVTIKRFNKRYELAVYPNKLYEYRHNSSIPLLEILHSENIFRSVISGEVCSEADLNLFNQTHTQIIHYILQNGHEQKPAATNQYELANVEKQIVELVQSKVLYNGSYIPKDNLLVFIKRVWVIKNSDAKKQVGGIIKKLEEIGFERVRFKLKLDKELALKELSKLEIEIVEDGVIVKSDVLHDAIDLCDKNGIKYTVSRMDEVEEEEIC
ncbi:hypothetical protein GINT2_000144 [Glugoides intestinalis]